MRICFTAQELVTPCGLLLDGDALKTGLMHSRSLAQYLFRSAPKPCFDTRSISRFSQRASYHFEMHKAPAAILKQPITGDAGSIHQPRDPNTLSNYNAWRCQHITANLEIDFDSKKLHGNVILQLKKLHENAEKIILDTR